MQRLVRSMVVCGALALFAAAPALGNDGHRDGNTRHDWQHQTFDDRGHGHDHRHYQSYREIEHHGHYHGHYRPSYQHYRPVAPSGWSTSFSGPRGNTFWFFYGR